MAGGEKERGRSADEVTVTVPVAAGEHLSARTILDTPEPWEETTDVEEPWAPEPEEASPLSRLALPPAIDELDDEDNELTDYAVVVEPTTVTARVERSPTPPLVPRGPLPPALTFRTNLGTTPPPRSPRPPRAVRVSQAETPAISWDTPTPEEEMVGNINLDLRKRISPLELQRVTLRGPAAVPPAAHTRSAPLRPQVGTHAALQLPVPETSLQPQPRSRRGVAALIAGGVATGVVGALLFLGSAGEAEGPSMSTVATPEVEVQTQVVSVPVLVPMEQAREDAAATTSPEPQDEMPRIVSPYRGPARHHFDEGLEELANDDLAAAEHSFRRAMRADANFDAPIRALGRVYERSGDERQAMYWYRRYIKRVPNGTQTPEVRQRLQILRRQLHSAN